MSRQRWQCLVDGWFADHHGAITAARLEAFGCSDATIRRMVQRGELIRMASGVYRSRATPQTALQRMSAVCQRYRQLCIGFLTACSLWSIRGIGPQPRIHVLVDNPITPDFPGLIVHRCRRIDPVDIVVRPDGIRLASPPRAVFDAADMMGPSTCASAVEQIVDQYCQFETVVDTLRRLGHPRRPGTKTMTAVIRSRPAWQQAVQSGLEHSVMEEIAAQGLPRPVTQHRITLPTGRTIRFDFAWPEQRVALEVDHPAWHDGAEQSHRDKLRDRKAATIGWETVRVTNLDVHGGLAEAVHDVALVLVRRGFVPPTLVGPSLTA